MSLDRQEKPVHVRDDSLIYLAVNEPSYLSVLKPIVEAEFHLRQITFNLTFSRNVDNKYKYRLAADRTYESDFAEKKKEAQLNAYREAAKGLGIVNKIGVPPSRNWCRGMLTTLIERYFKKVGPPTFAVEQNNPDNADLGFFCELYHARMDESEAPRIRSGSFKRKREAMNDAAYRALCTWKCDNLIENIDIDSDSDS